MAIMMHVLNRILFSPTILSHSRRHLIQSSVKVGSSKKQVEKEAARQARLWQFRNEVVFKFDHNRNVGQQEFDWSECFKEMIKERMAGKENAIVVMMSALQMKDNESHDSKMPDESLIKSFIKYIESVPKIRAHYITASKYCSFLAYFSSYLDDRASKEALEITNEIMAKYREKNITYPVVHDCLIALAKTSKDNCLYAIKLLPELNTITSNHVSMNSLFNAAFSHQLFQEAFQLMKQHSHINLEDETVRNCLNAMLDKSVRSETCLQMFDYMREAFVIFNLEMHSVLFQVMQKCGYKVSKTKIADDGLCHQCGGILNTIHKEEFDKLRTNMKSLVFNKDVDLKFASFPQFEYELKRFEEFLFVRTLKRPFDLVVDGLNVSYTNPGKIVENHKKNDPRKLVRIKHKSDQDRELVDIFEKNNLLTTFDNILLIGRNHMRNWPRLSQLLDAEKEKLSHFWTLNQTTDDTYVLYAAMQHLNTFVLSNDFYRDYRDKFNVCNLGHLFDRWLQSRQILLREKTCYADFPKQFDIRINISENGMHFPVIVKHYNQDDNKIKWLCCYNTNI